MKYEKLNQKTYSSPNDWCKSNNKWQRKTCSRDFTPALFGCYRMDGSDSKCKPTKFKNWRWRMRKKVKQQYSLKELLNHVSKENRQTVLKDLCHQELQPFIRMKKQERNERRNEFTKCAMRSRFPEDPTRHILTFTRF